MPVIFKEKTYMAFDGMVCDVCKAEDLNGCSDFVLRHTFGYGSPRDSETVEAAICDICLEKILQGVPGAVWT